MFTISGKELTKISKVLESRDDHLAFAGEACGTLHEKHG